MLEAVAVQISAAIGLGATCIGIAVGIARSRRGANSVRVVATGCSAWGTQALWIAAVFAAMFWAVAYFLVPAYASRWPSVPDFPLSSYVQVLGIVLGISGGLLYARSARALGRQMTPVIQVRSDHTLVVTGPYRFIRHPIYSAILLIALGQTLLYLSPLVAGLAILLGVLAVYRSIVEERLLRSAAGFGATYEEYAFRTGRFFPRIARRLGSNHPG